MAKGGDRPGEFDLISRVLAPLSVSERGAFHLTDDAALLAPRKGSSFVVTADAIVEGVHFLKSDPPFKLAQKALRVNLSDLAAKGAKPRAYLMTTAWPDWARSPPAGSSRAPTTAPTPGQSPRTAGTTSSTTPNSS